MAKNKLFHILSLSFIIIIYLFIDFLISNTIYKKSDCFNFSFFENGYYYDLEKNCKSKYRFKSGFPTVDFITNENGLRTSISKKKFSNSKENIFLFGDSFTFGVGLNYEDTYASILENEFKKFNFFNFAVGSYSPTVHLYRLKNAIKKNIYPKKIFLFLDLTDVIDESQRWISDSKLGIPIRPEDRSNRQNNFIHKNFKLTLEIISLINSNLNNFKKSYFQNEDNKEIVKTSIQGQFTYTPKNKLNKIFWKEDSLSKGLEKIENNIKEMSEISKFHNSEFYLVIYPWAETLEYGQKEFNWSKYASNLCTKYKCITIDTIPYFQKYMNINKNWVSDLYFKGDEHFNKGGAKLLGDAVIKFIKNKSSNY